MTDPPDILPVSFRKGGFTHGGQVHMEGTYGFLPRELAEWDSDTQVQELGDVYWEPGVRRGFTPASETYLAGSYQRLIANEQKAGQRSRTAVAEPSAPPSTQKTWDDEDQDTPPEYLEPDPGAEPDKAAEPFPGALSANIDDTRRYLSTASDEEVTAFIEWERTRTDREPRRTLLRELGAEA